MLSFQYQQLADPSPPLVDAEAACGVAVGELLLMEPPDRYSHEDGTVPGDAKVSVV